MSSLQVLVLASFFTTLITLMFKGERPRQIGQAIAVATIVLMVGTGLRDIAKAEERQAEAAEQQTKLLQEPGVMSQELGELVKVLKELQAAESGASAPKR